MLFNSYIFIFIFLPITLLGWYFFNSRKAYKTAMYFLAGMSLWFYGYFNYSYLLIIIASILGNYLLSYLMNFADAKRGRKIGLGIGLTFNLGLLFYFKYYDFFISNINAVFHVDFNLKNILLPLGISFFTFQQISFVVDRCTGKAEHYAFADYIAFVTFFPQLVAGPIVLYNELIPQFKDTTRRKFQMDNLAKGITLFVIGLSKKVLLADVLALPVNYGFANDYLLDTPTTILVAIAYAFELYFDFSGYSDMAMGLGKMFNIELPMNFNSPLKSRSMKELWQRWHMTLTRFFTQYVYIPLGGSRKGKTRTLINVFIVFMLSGLWHGANWTFVVWGMLQGIMVIWDNLGIIGIKQEDGKAVPKISIPGWLGWITTFAGFTFSFVFFRSESVAQAFQMFQNIGMLKGTGVIYKVVAALDIPEFYVIRQMIDMVNPNGVQYAYLALFVLLLLVCAFIISRKNAVEIVRDNPLSKKMCIGTIILFAWCVISFSQVSTFIYFNF